MVSNKKMGNDFEEEFAQLLGRNEFWVHRLTQSQAGQPADIIAARNGHAYLIDCKNCVNGYFDTNRIEPNQHVAMQLWEECRNGGGIFAIKISSTIWMCPLWKLEMTDKVKLDSYWFQKNAITIQQWLLEEG